MLLDKRLKTNTSAYSLSKSGSVCYAVAFHGKENADVTVGASVALEVSPRPLIIYKPPLIKARHHISPLMTNSFTITSAELKSL